MKIAITFLVMTLTVAYAEEIKAAARLVSNNIIERNVTGLLTLVQSVPNGPVTITGYIAGLDKNKKHGFHVHEKGDLSEGCKSTAAHFNPEKVHHGAPEDTVRHVGDLGNIETDNFGNAKVNIVDTRISLSGSNNIIGRAFVVHAGEDDLGKTKHELSNTTGNSGARWACGVIGIVSGSPNVGASIESTPFLFASLLLFFALY